MQSKIYLNRYRLLLDEIGLPSVLRHSAFEATFKAEDISSNEAVALQIIPVAHLRPSIREQLEAEAVAAKQLRHVNISELKDFGFEGDQLIYATAYFDGTPAEEWVKTHGPMPLGAVLRIAGQAVGAMAAAAFHGIFHHLLNPSNIMLVPGQTAEGEWPLIKVLNFIGVAPGFAPSDEGSGGGVDGAVNYASPEQLRSGNVDFRSEIYSLGCTLWFLLSGAPPLAGAATVKNARGLPAAVRQLLGPMLAAEPDQRPLDPMVLHEQIQSCLAHVERREAIATKLGLPVASTTAPLKTSPRSTMPMRPLALAALLLAIAALAAFIVPRYFTASRNAKIGVPIGVRESSPKREVSTAPTPSRSVLETTDTESSSPAAIPPAQPPVLVSTANTSDDRREAEPPVDEDASAAEEEGQATRLAPDPVAAIANETSDTADTQTQSDQTPLVSPRVAANNVPSEPLDQEPQPPSEGPANEETSAPSAKPDDAVVSTELRAVETREETSRTHLSPPQAAPRENSPGELAPGFKSKADQKSLVAAKTPKRLAQKTRQILTAGMPPLPRGSVRAQFLGTTADGNLIFGLPSLERGYVAPGELERDRSTYRRSRRSAEPPMENLPVLRALPPDE